MSTSYTIGLWLLLAATTAVFTTATEAKKVHYVHWNRASPMFRIDNTDHIVDVKEYDQVNLICPVSKPGSQYPESHVIYSVSREEFDSCRITNPKPKIVAICNRPHRLMYFTITFRSFTPTPGGLEFRPGQDYYFISTSTRDDLHRRVGGGCSTHNMKMIFKVHKNQQQQQQQQPEHPHINEPRLNTIPDSTTPKIPRYHVPGITSLERDFVYYYHPRDIIDNSYNNNNNNNKKSEEQIYSRRRQQNEVLLENSPLPFTSSESTSAATAATGVNLIFVTIVTVCCSCYFNRSL